MKVSIKFATAVILIAGALIASGSIAQASEGGAAGAVSAIMSANGDVEQLSAAAAVGKLNAAATLTTDDITSASGDGSGGGITLTVQEKLRIELLQMLFTLVLMICHLQQHKLTTSLTRSETHAEGTSA